MADGLDKVRVLLGPPGTGKTTRLLDEIERLLDSGVRPSEIAFVSFTKAATTEARERASRRFDIDPDAFDFFRTIHSMALRSIGKRDVLDDPHWAEFGQSFRYEFTDEEGGSDDGLPVLNFEVDGDCLRSLHNLARLMRCSVEEAILHAGDVPAHITADMVRLFGERLSGFKRAKNLIDFTDMLEASLVAAWQPPVRYAFIDEAQDNCRLQNALTKRWFWDNPLCERVTYAGDDDQAIFGWSGGDRGALVRLSGRTDTTVLDQSWRVPRAAHALAMQVIRHNRERVDKMYRPRDDDGMLLWGVEPSEALEDCEGSAFILVRNVMYAHHHRKLCLNRGDAFSCEVGAAAPLDKKDPQGAFRAVAAWRRGGNAVAQDFISLLKLIPSMLDGQRILPLGVKTKAAQNEDVVPAWRAREQFGLATLLAEVSRDDEPFGLLKGLVPEERAYLRLVLLRDPYLRRPKKTITTMHRSKGREADSVVLCPDMARRTFRRWMNLNGDEHSRRAREEERSVQYVAMTRTKSRLILERASSRMAFDWASYRRSAA